MYATYQGDQGNIYPSNKLGGVHRLGKNKLAALLNARRELSAESVMVNTTVEALSLSIRAQIENKLQLLIPCAVLLILRCPSIGSGFSLA